MEPERITFPAHDYPVKVVARASQELRARVDAIFSRHFGDFPADRVSERSSAQSNFVGLTYVVMRVETEEQLRVLDADLKALEGVMVVI